MKEVFKCEDCRLSFAFQSLYNRHRLVHSRDRKFKCSYCSKRFKRSDTLKTHQNIHTGNSRLICCGKTHNSKAALRYHQKLAHCSGDFDMKTDVGTPAMTCQKGLETQKQQTNNDLISLQNLIVFQDKAMVEEQVVGLCTVSTPQREVGSLIFDSLKMSLFK